MEDNKKTTNARMTLREAIIFCKNPYLEQVYNEAIHEFWEQTGYSIPEDTAFIIGQEVYVRLNCGRHFGVVTAIKQDAENEYYDIRLEGEDDEGLRYLKDVPLDYLERHKMNWKKIAEDRKAGIDKNKEGV